jgi:mannose-6-phosphate isomerase
VKLLEGLGLDATRLRTQGLKAYFEWAMTLPPPERAALAARVVRACVEQPPAAFLRECGWAARLGAQYPDDVGVVGALLLNLVTLQPGEALYLPAGNLHAYLEGVAVEIQASSDNVLRGGLTPKHVDTSELLKVLDFTDRPVERITPRGALAVYETPAPEFELTRLELSGGEQVLTRRGPDIFLVVEGSATVKIGRESQPLARGASVFIDFAEGDTVTLSGRGVVFRATVGR